MQAKKLKKQAKPEKSEPDEEDTKSQAASEKPKLLGKKPIKERLGVVNEVEEENQESGSEVEQPNEKPLATSKVIQEPAHSPSPSPVTKTDEPEVPEYKVSNKD